MPLCRWLIQRGQVRCVVSIVESLHRVLPAIRLPERQNAATLAKSQWLPGSKGSSLARIKPSSKPALKSSRRLALSARVSAEQMRHVRRLPSRVRASALNALRALNALQRAQHFSLVIVRRLRANRVRGDRQHRSRNRCSGRRGFANQQPVPMAPRLRGFLDIGLRAWWRDSVGLCVENGRKRAFLRRSVDDAHT